MDNVYSVSEVIDVGVPAGRAWGLVGNFADISWQSGDRVVEMETIDGRQARTLRSPDIGETRHLLTSSTDDSYSYELECSEGAFFTSFEVKLAVESRSDSQCSIITTAKFSLGDIAIGSEAEGGEVTHLDPMELVRQMLTSILSDARTTIESQS